VLWSPLPPITWLIPFIGHVGIADSNGIASDFRGPYYVGDDGNMAFGKPTRALKMTDNHLNWDEKIHEANQIYGERMHNIFCDNCHSHVAYALNKMGCKDYNIRHWDMVRLCFLIFFRARFLSLRSILLQFGPFICIMIFFMIIK